MLLQYEPEVYVIGVHDHSMKLIMNLEQLDTFDDVLYFLDRTQTVIFGVAATL
jgi:hypothetical protein